MCYSRVNIIFNFRKMIFDFLKKQTEISKKKELIVIMIRSINIPEQQKDLYLESLDILDEQWIHTLYNDVSHFVENIEMKELAEIKEENFSNLSWMRKKEAEEKKKEINSFSFILHNL